MELIPDKIDLRAYMDTPDFAAQVRNASDFADKVKADLNPNVKQDIGPGIGSIQKAKGLIGFRSGELTLWEGFNGHRKSMATGQVAIDLAEQGERVLIVSLEMTPWRTMSRMTRQACGARYPSLNQIDRFNDWTNGRMWLFDFVGKLEPIKAVALCRYFAENHKGTHIFLDSWLMMCPGEDDLNQQKDFATDLCRVAQETQMHLHVVAHCRKPGGPLSEARPPGRYDIRGSGAIPDQASNVIAVWANKSKAERLQAKPDDMAALAEPDGILKIDKQRNADFEGSLKVWFDPMSLRFCDDRTSQVQPYSFLREQL